MLRRRARVVAACVVVLASLATVGVALAASLGVTSASVTVRTAAVTISPTTCTLSAADADSYVDQPSAATNFGAATSLDVRSQNANRNKRTFVRFNLASCAIPATALITSASLRLFMHSAPAASRTYDVHRVTANWTEAGITWTNQPATAGAATAGIATGTTSNVTVSWPVSGDLQAFVSGTANYGWRMRDQTEGAAPNRQGQFRSAEHGTPAQRPVLDIAYYP